jgi:hypothetical protein
VLLFLLFAGATSPANAQPAPFSWPYEIWPIPQNKSFPEDKPAAPIQRNPEVSQETAPITNIPEPKKPVVPTGPDVSGLWKGQLTQNGENTPYKVDVAIGPNAAETHYQGLDCDGKLIRIGASKSYVFFIEVITKGAAAKGGRCPDGTITMARSGAKLALLWFGTIKGDMVIAYGTLSK